MSRKVENPGGERESHGETGGEYKVDVEGEDLLFFPPLPSISFLPNTCISSPPYSSTKAKTPLTISKIVDLDP